MWCCVLVHSGNPHVMGPNSRNLPKILGVFGSILEGASVDEGLLGRIVAIWTRMQQAMPAPMLAQLWAMLNEQQRGALSKHMAVPVPTL